MTFTWPKNLMIEKFKELDSTNDEAKRLSMRDDYNYLIISDIQTKGRGRSGKEWVSNLGNLYFSLLLKENFSLPYLNAFPSITSLAVAKTLIESGINEQKIKLKWPNDILVDGKKIAGILLESKINPTNNNLDYLIIGCGININSSPSLANYQATSYYEEGKHDIDKKELTYFLLKNIHFYLQIFERIGFKEIITLWRQKEWGIDREVSLMLKNKEIKGTYKGINAAGNAEIQCEELIVVSSGEVFFN